MNPPLRPEDIELVDPARIAALRAMTPAQRLAGAFACNRTMRLRLAGHLHTRHPDWTDEQIQAEIARRMARGAS